MRDRKAVLTRPFSPARVLGVDRDCYLDSRAELAAGRAKPVRFVIRVAETPVAVVAIDRFPRDMAALTARSTRFF